MAEASVETSVSSRFFCHRCNEEIGRVLPGFKCPRCNSGFIEELETQPQNSYSDESSDGDDVEMVTSIGELLSQSIFSSLRDTAASSDPSNDESPVPAGSDGSSGSRRRRQPGAFTVPVRSTRRRTSSDRQSAPLENIIQEFIINLSGFEWDPNTQTQASNMFMYGNPGDYAFGRASLDTIITQLLNQMDGTGPPPMAKDKIAQIPTVTVEQQQVDQNMQCSVCWEDFKLAEPVRKLVCEHYFHTPCIVPWLQLHGTCPICRKALSEETTASGSNAAGPSTSTSNQTPTSSTSSSNSSNSSSSSTSWLNTASQSGPRIISSLLGSLTNALSGGSSSSPISSASSSASSSTSSSQRMESDDAASQRHQYNLRSRDRLENPDDDDSSIRTRLAGGGRGGVLRNFDEEYDLPPRSRGRGALRSSVDLDFGARGRGRGVGFQNVDEENDVPLRTRFAGRGRGGFQNFEEEYD